MKYPLDYSSNKMEYSESKAVLATDWSWGSFAIGKDFLEWGYGESGLLSTFTETAIVWFYKVRY